MNRAFKTEDRAVLRGTLALAITRAAGEGMHEDIEIANYGLEPVRFNLEIAMCSDFADLFEVKAHDFIRRGRIATEWDDAAGELRTSTRIATSSANSGTGCRDAFRCSTSAPTCRRRGRWGASSICFRRSSAFERTPPRTGCRSTRGYRGGCFWREGETTRWDASAHDGQIAIERQAWRPWAVEAQASHT